MNNLKIKENFVDPKTYTFEPPQEEPEYDDGKTKTSILREYSKSKYRIQDMINQKQQPRSQSRTITPVQKRVTISERKDITYGCVQGCLQIHQEQEQEFYLNREQQGLRDAFSRYRQRMNQH